jgi:hypothetical protein
MMSIARKDPVLTYQMNISQGRERVHEIRRELFAFPEILDVFVASRPDALVIVYAGRPRLGEWRRALRAVGYEVPARRHPPPELRHAVVLSGIHAQVPEIAPARRPRAA